MNTNAMQLVPDIKYAFFDVDDTLISIKSMFSFQDFWYNKYGDQRARDCFMADMQRRHEPHVSWELLNRLYYRHFAGRRVLDVEQCGREWYAFVCSTNPGFYLPRPVQELREHQRQGREVVFVSGSFAALLQPIARHLGVRHLLATTLEIVGGRYTGEILPPQTIGAGKAIAISAFLQQVGGRAESCYGYGDDISDLPMLQLVGKPTVVSGGRGLESYARQHGWRVIGAR